MQSGGKKIRVLFLISSLAGGGAERVLISIVNNLDRTRFSPSIALFEQKGEYLKAVVRDIRLYNLTVKADNLMYSFLPAVWRFSKLSQSFDLVFSFMLESNLVALTAKAFTGRKTIVSERINTQFYIKNTFKGSKEKAIAFFVKALYKRADRIVAPSEGIKKVLVSCFAINDSRIDVIQNPLAPELIEFMKEAGDEVEEKRVFFAGRLHPQKNIPLLLRAFKRVTDKGLKLFIAGTGNEVENLKRTASELGLSGKVVFLGFEKNPYRYMKKAFCLVLPSDYEGFPNVLLEAMACGCPVISTDCAYGPAEIIKDGYNGLLVPVNGEVEMANAIKELLKDNSLRVRLIEGGYKTIKRFRLDRIIKKYEQLILNTVGQG